MSDDRRTQQASLGCGTLILIALIVMFFGGRNTNDLEHEIRRLRSDVGELTAAVEQQTTEVRSMREQLQARPGAAPLRDRPVEP